MDVIDWSRIKALAASELAAGDKLLVKDVSATDSNDDFGDGVKSLLVSALKDAVQITAPTAFAEDGAITPTVRLATLTKAGVGAYTLAAPTAAQDGMYLCITSRTANAHVVTATGLLEDGVTGGAKNAATFAAFVGATITLVAVNLKWHTVALKAVTVA